MNRSRLLAATFLLTLVTSTLGTASGALPLVLDGRFGSVVLVEAVGLVVFLAVLGGGCLVGFRTSDPSDRYLSLAPPAFGAGAAGAALGTVLGFLAYSALIPQFGAFVATPFGAAGGPFGGIPLVGVLVPTVGAALMRGTVVALAVVAGAAIAHDDSPGATPLGERL
jgi:hypothetical protein